MGFNTTRGIGTSELSTSIHRKIGEVFTEIEVILSTAARNKNFASENRTQLQKKLKSASGAISVYLADKKADLTSAEIADLQLFQKNVNKLASDATVEKNPKTLLPRVQALRVELDDLLG